MLQIWRLDSPADDELLCVLPALERQIWWVKNKPGVATYRLGRENDLLIGRAGQVTGDKLTKPKVRNHDVVLLTLKLRGLVIHHSDFSCA
jgi:hypothetical protein